MRIANNLSMQRDDCRTIQVPSLSMITMLAEPTDVKAKTIRPVLKWAGGKRQLIPQLVARMPQSYGTYLEPFFGGGALFFHLQPSRSVIADANTELINLYRVIASDMNALVAALQHHKNDSDYYYAQRALDVTQLSNTQAAARTLYLNRTCFNGLYRVNKKGQFNVPFGKYVNPTICDEKALSMAAALLNKSTIVDSDYRCVLRQYAKSNDFVFLDPPYHPVSEYSDFKRYTKEQFREQDQIDLATEVEKLCDNGCHVLLTNSNTELILDLYKKFKLDVVDAKRNINSKAAKRVGKDVIVTATPKKLHTSVLLKPSIQEQLKKYPSTRFMGSKSKIIQPIQQAITSQTCENVLDLFSGSGVVSYMLKACGKEVISNDYMAFSAMISKALIENRSVTLPMDLAKSLLQANSASDHFVEQTFDGLYFTRSENQLIDNIRANLKTLDDPYIHAIATSALVRACFKKRPRGIFTYVGQRYNDGRKDLNTTLSEHFMIAVKALNNAVFDNGKNNVASRLDALHTEYTPDLVYIDPPYYSPYSDNEYVRRYHFVEGIACDWQGVQMQWETKTRKFKSYPTPFSTRKGAYDAFNTLFSMYRQSTMVVSYSSNSKPTKDELLVLLTNYKSKVEVVSVEHRYSFGNQRHKAQNNNNEASEYIFIASD